MKKTNVLFTILLMFLSVLCNSQDIAQSEVPSLVMNSFKQQFPKASDIEWKIKGDEYKVEFEIGFFTDHKAWFDKTGKMVKHKQDISSSDLPEVIQNNIKKEFSGYRIEDAEKMETGTLVTYIVKLESPSQTWKVAFGQDGKTLEKLAD